MTYDYGRFVWFEMVGPRPEEASRFYGEVVGWKVQTMDMPGGTKYPMAVAGEGPVGGFAELPQPDALPHWISYVSVENVDAAAKKVQKLGGRALMEAFDVPSVGRMQPVADPHGAAFYLFPQREWRRCRRDRRRLVSLE